MNITLRIATQSDANFLFQLQRATMQAYVMQTWGQWDEAWQRQRFRQHFNPDDCQIVLDQEQAIGVICIERRAAELYLSKLELLPDYQGRGIGTQLIVALLAEAAQQGVPVTLQVLKVNPARRLYERLGFVVHGETATHWLLATLPSQLSSGGETMESWTAREERLAAARTTGDQAQVAEALDGLGSMARQAGDNVQARACDEACDRDITCASGRAGRLARSAPTQR